MLWPKTTPRAATRLGIGRALDAYLLRDVEKAVALRSPSQQDQVERFWGAAQRRIDAADALEEPREALGALVLYREAFALLAAAAIRAQSANEPLPSTPAASWNALRSLVAVPDDGRLLTFDALRETLADEDPLALDALAPDSLSLLRQSAQKTAGWLRKSIEPRNGRAVRRDQKVRVGAAALLAVVVLYFLVAAALAKPNIAQGKPAFASSIRPGTQGASGINNGEIESTFGVHTNLEDEPWVMIDLGKPFPLGEIRVFNRGDGWADEGLPLVLESSLDGQGWREIDRRLVPYSQSSPFVAKPNGVTGRYVRVRVPRHGYIAISEIQVFAARALPAHL